jgi:hypothetical protein
MIICFVVIASSYTLDGTSAQKRAQYFFLINSLVAHFLKTVRARSVLFDQLLTPPWRCERKIFSSTGSVLLHALFEASIWYIPIPSQLKAMGYFKAIRPQRSVSSPHHASVLNPSICFRVHLGMATVDADIGGAPSAAALNNWGTSLPRGPEVYHH